MRSLTKVIAPVALTFLALAGCSKSDESTPTSASTSAAATTSAVVNAMSAGPGSTATAPPAPVAAGPLASTVHPDLLDPSKAKEKAPAVFKAKFTTTKGDFVIEVHRDWAPNGADRFYNLVKMGFFDDTRFFRAVENFMVQFGITGDPTVNAKWSNANIEDDPVKQSNTRGFVTFAQSNMPNSRSTQVFINYSDANARLDGMRFAPFGKVVEGMDIVDSLYKGYGEGAPMGAGPDQGRIQAQGNAYLDGKFPKLDGTKHAEIVNAAK
jgi:peptidyl-prolyl cis-trans isomerase A (cyclophilin A)